MAFVYHHSLHLYRFICFISFCRTCCFRLSSSRFSCYLLALSRYHHLRASAVIYQLIFSSLCSFFSILLFLSSLPPENDCRSNNNNKYYNNRNQYIQYFICSISSFFTSTLEKSGSRSVIRKSTPVKYFDRLPSMY